MPENSYPQTCREVGLSCEECIGAAASHMARLCTGLRGKAVGQLFVQMYTHPACAPMHAHFAAAYQEATQLQVLRPAVLRPAAPTQLPMRREPGRVYGRVRTAVA
jgi:hypothetical protein